MLFSAYRLDQYPDAEGFMAQVALMFSQYDDETLTTATNPLRPDCIQRTFKFPPTLSEISSTLDKTQDEIARKRRENPARKFIPYKPLPPVPLMNVFIGENVRGFERMQELHHRYEGKKSRIERHRMYDGTVVTGLWVPLGWWLTKQNEDEEMRKKDIERQKKELLEETCEFK